MFVKILSLDRRNMIASCSNPAHPTDSPRFFISWANTRFAPKIGDTYRANPSHSFVKRNDGSELVHGSITSRRSLEEQLNDSKSRKK